MTEVRHISEINNYKGTEIRGLQQFEQQGTLRKPDVLQILDQLPEGYSDKVKLGAIMFEDSKYFTVNRNGGMHLVKESEIQNGDIISRRVRGQTLWNTKLQNGERTITDGKQTIHIFSTLDWDNEEDKTVALYTLAHEIGHATWNALDKNQGLRFWQHLVNQGKMEPFKSNLPFAFIDAWKLLPESQLPRYVGYKDDFTKEHGRYSEGKTMEESIEDLSWQEDFATAHEYFLYWKNLQQLDSERQEYLEDLYTVLGK